MREPCILVPSAHVWDSVRNVGGQDASLWMREDTLCKVQKLGKLGSFDMVSGLTEITPQQDDYIGITPQ